MGNHMQDEEFAERSTKQDNTMQLAKARKLFATLKNKRNTLRENVGAAKRELEAAKAEVPAARQAAAQVEAAAEGNFAALETAQAAYAASYDEHVNNMLEHQTPVHGLAREQDDPQSTEATDEVAAELQDSGAADELSKTEKAMHDVARRFFDLGVYDYTVRVEDGVKALDWDELRRKTSGFVVSMTKKAAQLLAGTNAIAAFDGYDFSRTQARILAQAVLEHGADSLFTENKEVLATMLLSDDEAAGYEALHSLSREAAVTEAFGRGWSSTIQRSLISYGLGLHDELQVSRHDVTQGKVYSMTEGKVEALDAADFRVGVENPKPRVHHAETHEGNTTFVRERLLPGVERVVWEGDSKVVADGRELISRAPERVTLTDGMGARLLASQPKQNWYLRDDAPEWVEGTLRYAKTSRPKVIADLYTGLKRPGTAVIEGPGSDITMTVDRIVEGVMAHGEEVSDLGFWVVPDEVYARIAAGVDGSAAGGLQITAVFDGWYFKGLLVPETLSGIRTGMYDGFKRFGKVPVEPGAEVQRLTIMRSLDAEPWSASVNSQALMLAGVEDINGVVGVTQPSFTVPDEQADELTMNLLGLINSGAGARSWGSAQAAEAGRKRSTEGVAGVGYPVKRHNIDEEFVILTDDKEKDGDTLEAAFLFNPALPVHTQLMKVSAVYEYTPDVKGRVIAVNVAKTEFLAKAYIGHAGRDIDGDGFVLSTENKLVDNAVRWDSDEFHLTNTVKWKDTSTGSVEGEYAAIQEAYERQFNAQKLGSYELKARRAIQLGVNMNAEQIVEGESFSLRQLFTGAIQMAISSQKKMVREDLFRAVDNAITKGLRSQAVTCSGVKLRADHAVRFAGGLSGEQWSKLQDNDADQAELAREFYAAHGQDSTVNISLNGRSYAWLPTTLVDLPKVYGAAMRDENEANKRFGSLMSNWETAGSPRHYPKGSADGLECFFEDMARTAQWVFEAAINRHKVEAVVRNAPGGEEIVQAKEGLFDILGYEGGEHEPRMAGVASDHPRMLMPNERTYDLLRNATNSLELAELFNELSGEGCSVKQRRDGTWSSTSSAKKGKDPFGVFGAVRRATRGTDATAKLEELGQALVNRHFQTTDAEEIPQSLINALMDVREWWAEAHELADYRHKTEAAKQRLNTLVGEFGEAAVYGIALKGYGQNSRGKLPETLVAKLGAQRLLTLAVEVDVDVFGDDGFPIVVRDVDKLSKGLFTYGQLAAAMPEGGLFSVLPKRAEYRVYRVKRFNAKTETSGGAEFQSGGIVWVNPQQA